MKRFDEERGKTVEVAQLLILYTLFSQKKSSALVFQGGTAIRWCYGSERFSEDLDFVTSLGRDEIRELLCAATREVQREFAAHFGPGTFAVKETDETRPSAFVAYVEYKPDKQREKIKVKIEFERLRENKQPAHEQMVMSGLPTVSHFIQSGSLKIPRGTVLNVEKVEEILSDKVRALLERNYTKGRDYFDVLYLTRTLGVPVDPGTVARKWDMYEAPFTPARGLEFFTNLEANAELPEVLAAIDRDLSRFIGPKAMAVYREKNFSDLVLAVQDVFRTLAAGGTLDVRQYSSYDRRRTP